MMLHKIAGGCNEIQMGATMDETLISEILRPSFSSLSFASLKNCLRDTEHGGFTIESGAINCPHDTNGSNSERGRTRGRGAMIRR